MYSKVAADINALPQCNNASHAFQYDATFNYTMPECRYVVPEQLVVKGTQQVQFVTQFLENSYVGFPCATPGAGPTESQAGCAAAGGSLDQHANGQCVCKTSKTVYPVGVEEMVMSFEHTYEFPVGKFGLKEWRGSSTLTAEQVASTQSITAILPSSVDEGDGSASHISEGKSVSHPLKTWLKAAKASLDDVNTLSPQDQLNRPGADGKAGRLPHFRMTGLVITVQIHYANGDPTVAKNDKVYANISATKQLLAWAGPGSERIHVEYPSGALGSRAPAGLDPATSGLSLADALFALHPCPCNPCPCILALVSSVAAANSPRRRRIDDHLPTTSALRRVLPLRGPLPAGHRLRLPADRPRVRLRLAARAQHPHRRPRPPRRLRHHHRHHRLLHAAKRPLGGA